MNQWEIVFISRFSSKLWKIATLKYNNVIQESLIFHHRMYVYRNLLLQFSLHETGEILRLSFLTSQLKTEQLQISLGGALALQYMILPL